MASDSNSSARSVANGRIVAVVGATGTGKSELALDLAERLAADGVPAEIVNTDAMQFYRGMDIGTAKLQKSQRRGIPHHLLDVLEVTEESSVAWYQPLARAAIEEIIGRGSLPILVGGSGLYVSSVIYDFEFPARDATIRARLEAELIEVGPGPLFARLEVDDPRTAERIDPKNGRRIVRALEVHELAERGYGAVLPDAPTLWRPAAIFGLAAPRDRLVQRLDARVLGMWRDGLTGEVRDLLPRGLERGATASRAIGYSQALRHLHGELSEEEAIVETQALTRRYARRQVSWFKRYRDLHWLDYDDPNRVQAALDRLEAW
jgi:tRNA dimethylallyltransferase